MTVKNLLQRNRSYAVIVVIAVALITNCIPIYAQQKKPPLKMDKLIELSTAPEIRNRPEQFIKDAIEPILIGFLPTEAAKKELKTKGVSDDIINVLNEYTALILRVCKLKCQNCQSQNGERLAGQVRDAIIESRLIKNAFGPLINGGIESNLCGIEGISVNETNHVLIFVTGEIVRNKQQYQVNVTLNYLNYGESGGKQLGQKSWKIKAADSTQEVPKLIADWVVNSLRSAMN